LDWLWSAGVRGGEQFFVVFSDVSGAHFLQFGERFTRFAPSALTRSACGLRVKKKLNFFTRRKKKITKNQGEIPVASRGLREPIKVNSQKILILF